MFMNPVEIIKMIKDIKILSFELLDLLANFNIANDEAIKNVVKIAVNL